MQQYIWLLLLLRAIVITAFFDGSGDEEKPPEYAKNGSKALLSHFKAQTDFKTPAKQTEDVFRKEKCKESELFCRTVSQLKTLDI